MTDDDDDREYQGSTRLTLIRSRWARLGKADLPINVLAKKRSQRSVIHSKWDDVERKHSKNHQ